MCSWTPCSEKMPPKDSLCTDGETYWIGFGGTHWMELPELPGVETHPYRDGRCVTVVGGVETFSVEVVPLPDESLIVFAEPFQNEILSRFDLSTNDGMKDALRELAPDVFDEDDYTFQISGAPEDKEFLMSVGLGCRVKLASAKRLLRGLEYLRDHAPLTAEERDAVEAAWDAVLDTIPKTGFGSPLWLTRCKIHGFEGRRAEGKLLPCCIENPPDPNSEYVDPYERIDLRRALDAKKAAMPERFKP